MPNVPLKMNRKDAAEYIKTTYGIPCSAATLAKYACVEGCDGPAFRKFGQRFTIYDREDLDEWAKRRLKEDEDSRTTVRAIDY